jgi:hypothetical protein
MQLAGCGLGGEGGVGSTHVLTSKGTSTDCDPLKTVTVAGPPASALGESSTSHESPPGAMASEVLLVKQ